MILKGDDGMLQWLSQNWGNIVVLSVLAVIVGVIVFFHLRAKKKGKGGCGCGCKHCAMSGTCHAAPPSEQKNDQI
jgi:hypothetical protein